MRLRLQQRERCSPRGGFVSNLTLVVYTAIGMDKHTLRFYPESRIVGFSRADGAVDFYCRVNALVNSESLVVDFGCGRGEFADDPVSYRRGLRCFKGRVARVIGLDVDLSGKNNPTIDEFRRLVAGQPWPVEPRCADVIICDNVVEHLSDLVS